MDKDGLIIHCTGQEGYKGLLGPIVRCPSRADRHDLTPHHAQLPPLPSLGEWSNGWPFHRPCIVLKSIRGQAAGSRKGC
jgi:hypothetical protein